MDLILNGYSVTGLFRAVPQLTGVIEGGVWNKEKNSIYVSLTLLLPADLVEGEHTLMVTTQYSSSGYLLKEPRSISTQVWIGGKPADGGGDSESPDEI